jgi:hypothetical protein
MRIARRLIGDPEVRVSYVEPGAAGRERLAELGVAAVDSEAALSGAEVVILAVPDPLIRVVAAATVPGMRSGALLICLDPAAPQAGHLPARSDVAYFVVHPNHPPVVNDETDPVARRDFFGAIKAAQPVTCALVQGGEADYARGEAVARKIFAPVTRANRVTVEQMALLEPAMAETVVLTCMHVMKQAMDEVVRRGVPEQAARDFLMGHINVNIGILFGYVDTQFSDGAKKAVAWGMERLVQPDWRRVFEPESLAVQIRAVTGEGT